MGKISTCPDVGELKKLTTGHLPVEEMECLVQHLEECDACLAKVPALAGADTLVDAIAKAKTLLNGPDEPLLAGLIERLAKLGQNPAPAAAAKSITFSCATCGKNLKVKAELAGKKVKCPGCGKAVLAPSPSERIAPASASKSGLDVSGEKTISPHTLAPNRAAALSDERTVPPQQPDTKSGLSGVAQPGKQATADATQGVALEGDTEALDFLAPPQQPDELGRLERYRVLKKLGAGGMGMVFLAEDTRLHRKVALKVMLPSIAASAQARERFLREARSAASIEHEHIVPIFQVDEDNQVPFLAMPLLKGEPLDVRLEREGKLPVEEALRIAREMAEGLAAAHANNLIHRDIKPGNVWLEGKKAKVRLLDFGLARAQDDTTNLTQTGALVGTPAYMAPEQAKGNKLDGRADLFSLGCVLYVMLTGERPFKGNDTISLLMSLAVETPQLPTVINREVPDAVSDLTMRLLAKEPAERPASAQAVADELATLAHGESSGEPSPVRGRVASPTRKPKTKNRKPALIAVALVVAALLGGLLFFAPTIYRIATNQGELIVEVDDPDIEVLLKQDGVTVHDKTKQRDFVLTARAGQIDIIQDGVELTTRKFELTRGGKTRVKVTIQDIAEAKQKAALPAGDVKPGASPLGRLDAAKIREQDRQPWLPKETVAIVGDLTGRVPGAVERLIVSPDGKWLAASSRPLQLYEAATMRLHWEHANLNMGNNAAFLDGGKTLVAADGLWDLTRPEPKLLVSFKQENLAHFTARGSRLAAFYRDGTIRVWHWANGKLKELAKADHRAKGNWLTLALSTDGNTLASVGGGVGRLWEVSETGLKEKADLGSGGILSPDCKIMAAFQFAKPGDPRPIGISLWDVTGPKPQQKQSFEVPDLSLWTFYFSPDGKSLALPLGDNLQPRRVQIWSIDGALPEPSAESTFLPYGCAAFTPDGKSLFVGRQAHGDNAIVIFAVDDNNKLTRRFGPAPRNYGRPPVLFSPDGGSSLAIENGGPWLDLTGAEPKERPCPDDAWICGFSPQGLYLWSNTLFTWNGTQKKLVNGFPRSSTVPAITPDGRLAVVTRPDKTDTPLEIHDLTDGKSTKFASFKAGRIHRISSDGKTVLSNGSDSGEPAYLFRRDGDAWKEIWSANHSNLALSPRGDALAVRDGDTCSIIDVSKGSPHEMTRFPALYYQNCVAFAPDSQCVAVGNIYGNIAIREIATGRILHEWQLQRFILGLAYAPDGRHLAVSTNGVTLILRLAPAQAGEVQDKK